MGWMEWVVTVLAVLVAAWMLIDGIHALVTGDYVTPSSGDHAGQLGPWSSVVSAVGIPPRSTVMKAIFVIYGALWLGVLVGFVMRQSWAGKALLVAAIGSLWYLPFGTLFGVVQIVLLILILRR
ncbi:MAG: hypothetical protein Kow0074_22480 [Candidatus Zixiibacteriota bacterium]